MEASMPDFCEPMTSCTDLDGRLLLQRAVYGPQLAFDPGSLAFGGVASRGSALRPLLHIRFEMSWKSTGLCQGPATSIMSLAPGEVVTVGLRTRTTRTFSSLVRNAAEKSRSSSRTDRQVGPPRGAGGSSLFGGLRGALGELGGFLGGFGAAAGRAAQSVAGSAAGRLNETREFAEALAQETAKRAAAKAEEFSFLGDAVREALQEQEEEKENEAIELIQAFVGQFGSFLQDAAGAVVGTVSSGVAGAVNAVTNIADAASGGVADLVDNVVAGGGLVGTMQQIAEVIETVERSESESSLRETTVTTSTESEQTITRTFGNPYLDRSLQLRFLPVFQRFEVTTKVVKGTAGLATVVAEPDEPFLQSAGSGSSGPHASQFEPLSRGFGNPRGRLTVKSTLRASSGAGAESNLRGTMLSAVQKAAQASGVGASGVRLDQGLAWDRTTSLGNAVHVPLANADDITKVWNLKVEMGKRLKDALKKLEPGEIERIAPRASTRIVHVFAGLHVEPVAGTCVLPDIPKHLRVIVPGGTTYAITPKE
jgi:hypothetical protein